MSDETNKAKVECRREVLRFLAERHLLSHSEAAIRNSVNREGFRFSKDELLAALEFLKGLGFIQVQFDSLGATRTYQATSQGVLHHERD